MTKQEIIEILNQGGYVSKRDESKTASLYDYKDQHIMELPPVFVNILAKAPQMVKWHQYSNVIYVGNYLREPYRTHENTEHCKSIAETAEAYADRYMYRCPECNEEFYIDDDRPQHKCNCGFVGTLDEYELLSMWDYLSDCLDVEYRIGGDKEYRSAEICVAWGGPNIYIDTAKNSVELYWGGSRASWGMLSSVADEIDDVCEERYNCL